MRPEANVNASASNFFIFFTFPEKNKIELNALRLTRRKSRRVRSTIEDASQQGRVTRIFLSPRLRRFTGGDSRGLSLLLGFFICVDYYVFMPQTAKILTEGRVYSARHEIKLNGSI